MQAHVELYRERKRAKWLTERSTFSIDSEHPGMMRVNGEWLEEAETLEPGKWRWRFKKGRNIMADSGQGYSRRIDCLRSCAVVLGGDVDANGDSAVIHRLDLARSVESDVRVWEEVEVRDLTREDG